MGKAALLIVAALSAVGTSLVLSLNDTDVRARVSQSEYSADVIAREIARSAYNGAVGNANRHGTDIDAALAAVGTRRTSGCQQKAAECYRTTGEMQGGRFVVEARKSGGNGIEIYAAGFYAYSEPDLDHKGKMRRTEKAHEINESQSVDVLEVDPSGDGGKLKIEFVDSRAGYCSSIFLHRTLPGVAEADQPEPEMVYAPGNGRNGERNLGTEVDLAPGTQMNFAIGVSTDCKAPARFPKLRRNDVKDMKKTLSEEDASGFLKAEMARYDFRESDWDWVHWALDGSALRDGTPKEAPWGMVEADPANNQRWRIAFEDIHNWNLASDHPDFNKPDKSLWATKRFGYDRNNDGVGDGWADRTGEFIVEKPGKAGGYDVETRNEPDGFYDLGNWGNPADFSDQVIFVEVIPRDLAERGGKGTNGGKGKKS